MSSSAPPPGSPRQPEESGESPSRRGLLTTLVVAVIALAIAVVVLASVLLTGDDDDEPAESTTETPAPLQTAAPGPDEPTQEATDPALDDAAMIAVVEDYLEARVTDDCDQIEPYVTEEFLDEHDCAGGTSLENTTQMLAHPGRGDSSVAMSTRFGAEPNHVELSTHVHLAENCTELQLIYPVEDIDAELLISGEQLVTFREDLDADDCR